MTEAPHPTPKTAHLNLTFQISGQLRNTNQSTQDRWHFSIKIWILENPSREARIITQSPRNCAWGLQARQWIDWQDVRITVGVAGTAFRLIRRKGTGTVVPIEVYPHLGSTCRETTKTVRPDYASATALLFFQLFPLKYPTTSLLVRSGTRPRSLPIASRHFELLPIVVLHLPRNARSKWVVSHKDETY